MPSKSRQLSRLINGEGVILNTRFDSDALGVSATKSVTLSSGTIAYSSADTLPTSADNGDQALVTSTNRLYIFTNGGWYNIALVNSTPYFTTSPSASYELSNSGGQTNIEILAVDSEGINIVYSAVTNTDFDNFATVTKDSDNGRRFTITVDSDATTTSSGTVTFRASDGVNIATAVSTFTLEFVVTNSKFTTSLLKADTAQPGGYTDRSSSAKTITGSGNVTGTGFSPYNPKGYSAYFGGSEYLLFTEVGDQYELGVNTNFTIELWVYATDLSSTHTFISQGTTNNTSNLSVTSAGEIYLQYYVAGTNRVTKTTSGAGITANTWYHIAMTHEASNSGTANAGKNIFYVNGTEVDSVVNTSYAWYNGTDMGNMEIGRYQYSNANYFSGYIRDFRITKSLVYTGNFTAPTEALTAITNCELLCCHMPYFVDGSTNDSGYGIGAGTPKTKPFVPYDTEKYTLSDVNGSLYFDGSGDLLTMASSADFNLGDEYTVEMWVYQEVRDASEACRVFMAGVNGDSNGFCFSINSAGQLDVGRPTASGGISGAGGFIPLQTWCHLAVVKQGSTATGYINGNYVTHDGASTTQTSGNVAAKIGYDTPGTVSEQFNGYIQDLQVIKGRTKYPLATSSGRVFTPATSPYAVDSDAVLFTCANNNKIYDTSTGYYLIKNGNVTASNTQRNFTSSSSIYFDGTGDYLTLPNKNSRFTIGDLDFTIELWHYPTSLSNHRNVYEPRSTGSQVVPSIWLRSDGFYYLYVNGVNVIEQPSGEISINNWYHVAVARSGSSTKLFVNGVQKGSTYTDTNTYVSGAGSHYLGHYFGGGSTYDIAGYVQDFRFTKGLARYTSNFTPPTFEFSG